MKNFSTRLKYAEKKIKERYFSMMNIKYKTIDGVNKILQQIKRKIEKKFPRKQSDYYDQMNCMRQSNTLHFEEDPSSKSAEKYSFYIAWSFTFDEIFSNNTSKVKKYI